LIQFWRRGHVCAVAAVRLNSNCMDSAELNTPPILHTSAEYKLYQVR